MTQHHLSRSRPQHIAVIDRVATGQRRVDHRHRLVTDIRPPWGVTQIHARLEQLPHTQMLGQRGQRDQSGRGDQTAVIEGHPNGIEAAR